MIRALAAAVLAAALLCSPAAAQNFPYEQFSPDTLSAFAARINEASAPSPEERVVLLGRVTKVRVQATFLGERRPIDPVTAAIILRYVKAGGEPDAEAYAALYREFYAFEDEGRRYWLPVQHQVAAFFPEELKPGQRIELYALAVGGLAAPNQRLQPLLLVQEFETENEVHEAPRSVAPAD
jgi:hypothetical protein